MMWGGRIKWKYEDVWIAPAPAKVRIFTCLLLHNKLLTHEVMATRHFTCDLHCVMCGDGNLETSQHLFFSCKYANHVWDQIQVLLGVRMNVGGDSVEERWDNSLRNRPTNINKATWTSRLMSGLWFIWRQRNEQVFCNKKTASKTVG
ncbi:uncharacterized protein LOC144560229 [Carex rostrata]